LRSPLHQSISYQTTALVIPPCPSEHAIPHRHLCRAFMSRGRLCGTISRVLFAVEIGLIYLCVMWLPLPVEDGKPLPGLPGSRISWFAMTICPLISASSGHSSLLHRPSQLLLHNTFHTDESRAIVHLGTLNQRSQGTYTPSRATWHCITPLIRKAYIGISHRPRDSHQ
jgi:hypothetical protein